ncbi:MAG: SDR family NAD(P)-dependent oxidoreductase [Bdellovibrionales bacterium]|nr:SDR family NAD(P)-dependent oxidoreductase [Bdellovibrionales bacterium]
MTRSAFITGGTSGIGLEFATRYVNAGWKVAVCSFESAAQVEGKIPAGVTYFSVDVTDAAKMADSIRTFAAQAGSLDLVIANAGINHPKAKIPDFVHGNKVINVNVNGVLNTFGPAIEIMVKQKSGQLVALSSIAGTIGGLPGMSIYCASKAAVLSLCDSLEVDLAQYGIKVTTLAPGFIDTPLTRGNDHPMPFRMTIDQAVTQMMKYIERGSGRFLFPLPMKIISTFLSLIPKSLAKTLLKSDAMKTGKH